MEVLDYEKEQQNRQATSQQQRDDEEDLDNKSNDREAVSELTAHINDPISAKIVSYKTVSSTFNSYAVYEIVLNTECSEYGKFENYVIERRFSHFLDLYSRLFSQFPDVTIPLPPPKNYSEFAAFDMTESNRLAWLQVFIDLILLQPVLRASALVVQFFTHKSPPDQIQLSPAGMLKSNVGRITEKIISLKYADMDSDEWYIDLKNQLFKIESSLKSINHKLGGASVTFKPFASDFLRAHMLIREFSTQMGAGTPNKSLNALADIFKMIGDHCNKDSSAKDKANCYNSVYTMLIVHLGSINLIIRTFKTAFEERDKIFRPICDLDNELKELQIAKTNDMIIKEKMQEIENSIARRTKEIQMHRKNFNQFSSSQKAVLSLYKNYLNEYIKSTLQTFLENVLEVEKSKLNSLQAIKAALI